RRPGTRGGGSGRRKFSWWREIADGRECPPIAGNGKGIRTGDSRTQCGLDAVATSGKIPRVRRRPPTGRRVVFLRMSGADFVWIISYGLVVLGLSAFGIHRYVMVYLFLKNS